MGWGIIHLEEFIIVDLLYKKKAHVWITVPHQEGSSDLRRTEREPLSCTTFLSMTLMNV